MPEPSQHGAVVGRRGRIAGLVVLAVLAFRVAGKLRAAHVITDKEYDEGVYLCSARALAEGHELFREIFFSQPPLFVETLAMFLRAGGNDLLSGRAYALAFDVLALAACAEVARRVAGPWAAAGTVAAMALHPTMFELGGLVQAEVPALAVALCAFAACLHALQRQWRVGLLVLCGAMMGVACLFKLFVVPMIVPFLFLLAMRDGEGGRWQLEAGRPKRIGRRGLFVACAMAAPAVLALMSYDTGAMLDQTVSFHVAKRSAFSYDMAYNAGVAADFVRSGAGIAIVAAGGLIALWRRNRSACIWLSLWLAVALLAVLRQSPLFWRHASLLLPPLAVAAGAAVAALAAHRMRPLAATGVIAAFALMGVSVSHQDGVTWEPVGQMQQLLHPRQSAQTFLHVAHWLRANSSADEKIVTDDPLSVFLADRSPPPQLCDTSVARIRSGYLTVEYATMHAAAARIIVLRPRSRLSNLGGFYDWVGAHYRRVRWDRHVGHHRAIWVRGQKEDPP